MEKMNFCRNCGHKIEEDGDYCAECGFALYQEYDPNYAHEQVPTTYAPQPKTEPKRSTIGDFFKVLVAIVVAGAVTVFVGSLVLLGLCYALIAGLGG